MHFFRWRRNSVSQEKRKRFFSPRFDIDEEGDSVMSPVVAQFHDDPRVKTVAAGALTAVET